jgi:ankyrin repeat protein
MNTRKTSALALAMIAVAGMAIAAERAVVADAAERRDHAAVRTLLAKGADVNAAQVDGTTALHWATHYDDAEAVALLVKAGANVNAANRFGVPPLVLASTNGNATVVRLLLEAGADANATMKGGETPLMLAARAGSVDAVRALLVRGAKHDRRELHGQTALMWAAAEGHTAVMRALIEAGADIHATLNSGFTPFFFAVREGRIEAVKLLLEKGVDVNAPIRRPERPIEGVTNAALFRPIPRGITPLMVAVQSGHFELAIALVDAGANPNDVQMGFSPLHILSGVRKPDSSDGSDPSTPAGSGRLTSLQFAREIVKRGANVNLRLEKNAPRYPATSSRIETPGATPFLLAADRADVPLMRVLLELGADPMLPNFNNTTPLMAAAGLGTTEPLEEAGEEAEALEATKMLLDLGANVNAVDNDGSTAMHGAAYGAYSTVVTLLAERGADPQIWKERNKAGVTPLFAAEGYIGRLPRPDKPTIEAVTKLMAAAGLSTAGERPPIVDIYEKQPEPTRTNKNLPERPKTEKP